MSVFGHLIARDLRRAWTSGGLTLPIAFFLLAVVLFPFAIGPDREILSRIASGAVWTAALLAALLPVERLVVPDMESGVIDQLVVRGLTDPTIAAAKIVAHWLGFAPALLTATVAAAALLGMDGDQLRTTLIALAIGTPGLAALGVITAALVAGLRGAAALAGLIMLPFALPLLIFGAGVGEGEGALKLLAATSLLLVAGAPFVAGSAMRMARG